MAHITIPADAPPGGMSWELPATTTISYFKLAPSNTITFQWNLTSLYVTPTSLTFSAYCSSNHITYPIGPTSIPATATSLLWVPWAYQTAAQGEETPLIQGTYVLEVQDERGTTALGTSGQFQYNTAVTFAMYTPQPYTPLSSETSCAGCNSAALAKPHSSSAAFGVIITLVIMAVSGWRLLRSTIDHSRERS